MRVPDSLRRFPALALIAALPLSVPFIPVAISDARWHGLRTGAFEAGGAVVLCYLLVRPWTHARRRDWGQALRAVPLRFLLAFFGWNLFSALLAPVKPAAWQGVMQLGTGVLIAAAVASEARRLPQYGMLLNALAAATLLLALSGIALSEQAAGQLAAGLYHDHMLYGAVFVCVLPPLFAVSLSDAPLARRLTALAAFLSGGIALGLAQTRSAWVGVLVSAAVFAALLVWTRASARRPPLTRSRRLHALLLGGVALGGLAYLLMTAPQTARVQARLQTLTTATAQDKESLVVWRFQAWRGARRMIAQKPLLGWGVGCYPYRQYAFTGLGHGLQAAPNRLQAEPDRWPTITDEAHNSYLQIAAETGLPACFCGAVCWRRRLAAGSRRCAALRPAACTSGR